MGIIRLLVACLILCNASSGYAAGDYRGDEAALHRATGTAIQSLMNHWIIRTNIQLLLKQTGLGGHVPISGKMESSSSTETHEPHKNSGFQCGAMLITTGIDPY